MRKNMVWIAALIVAVAIIIALIVMGQNKPEALDAKPRSMAAAKTQAEQPAQAEVASASQAAPSAETPAVETQAAQPTQEPPSKANSDLPPELAKKETPVWTIVVPLVPGVDHIYSFILDGTKVLDPLNKSPKGIFDSDIFSVPPKPDQSSPRLLPGNRGQFFYEGPVKMHLWLNAEYRGGPWAIDEFQPANEAARKNLQEMKADKSLASVHGVVVDGKRNPVPRARVRAVIGFNHQATVECDNYGQFRIDRLPAAEVGFSAHTWGFQDSEWKKLALVSGSQNPPMELVIQPGVVIMGTVRDESGKPVNQARIEAASKIPGFFGPPSVSTDASGHYVHANLPPEKYTLTAKHLNFAPVTKPELNAVAGQKPIQVDFVLPNGGMIGGKVVQEVAGKEQPVASVKVSVSGSPLDSAGSRLEHTYYHMDGMSKEDGSFEIAHIPYNSKFERAEATKGSIQQSQPVDIVFQKGSHPEPIIIHLPAAARLAGRVVDAAQKPVIGAAIYVAEMIRADNVYEYIDNRDKEKSKRATTDAEGKFTVDGVAAGGKVRLQAEASGFAPTKTEQIPTSTESEVLIVMKAGGTIAGRVVMADTKAPVKGAKVQARQSSYDGPYSQNAPKPEAVSKEDGTFELVNMPEGGWYLGGEAAANSSDPSKAGMMVIDPKLDVQVKEGQRTENVELIAYAGLKIKGKVLVNDDKQPVPSAQVEIRRKGSQGQDIYSYDQGLSLRWYGQSSATGEFEYGNVAPGKYSVSASKQGLTKSEQKDIEVMKGQNLEGLEIYLTPGGLISGVVVNASDQPVSQTQVQAEMQRNNFDNYWHDSYQTRATSDKDGKFTITGVPLDKGMFRVVTSYGEKRGYGESEYVKITAEKSMAEVVVKIQAISSITGTVKDQAGKPLGTVSLRASIYNPQSGSSYIQNGTTDAQGKYTIQNLAPVEHTIEATRAGFAKGTQRIVLKAGEAATLDFVMEPSKALKGVLVDLNMKKLGGWRVQASIGDPKIPGSMRFLGDSTSDPEGRFSVDGLGVSDKVRLNIQTDNNRGYGGPSTNYRQCSFRTGEISPTDQEQAFVLPVGGTIKGRILYEGTNKPALDAKISMYYKNFDSSTGKPSSSVEPQGTQCVLQYASVNAAQAVQADGTFQVGDLPVGTYVVSVGSDSSARKQLEDVVLDTSMLADLKDILLSVGCTITGRLVDGVTGQPYLGVEGRPYSAAVMFKDASGAKGSGNQVELDKATGRFKFGGIAPSAPYCVLLAMGYLPTKVDTARLSPSAPLDLGDVRLQVGETIKGKLSGPNGEPAIGAQVVAVYKYEGEDMGSMGMTDEKGEFTIKGLMTGSATLRAYVQGNRNPWVNSNNRMAQIEKYEFTIAPGGSTYVEAKFPAQTQPTPTPSK